VDNAEEKAQRQHYNHTASPPDKKTTVGIEKQSADTSLKLQAAGPLVGPLLGQTEGIDGAQVADTGWPAVAAATWLEYIAVGSFLVVNTEPG